MSLDLKQSSDSAVTASCGRLFQSGMVLGKNDVSVVCPAGWGIVDAGVVFPRAQSAAWWFWQVAGVHGDRTRVELVEHLRPRSLRERCLLPCSNDDVESGTDVDVRSIVNILCDSISDLEKAFREQSALIADLTRHGLRVDAGVQADIENRDRSYSTYADIVKSTPSTQNVIKSASGQSVGDHNISVEPSHFKCTGKMSRIQKWNGK